MFICIDPYLTDQVVKINHANIMNGVTEYRYIELQKPRKHLINHCYALLNDCDYSIKNENSGNIIRFSEDLERKLDFKNEISITHKHDLFAVPLFDKLRIIKTYRHGYSMLINHIGDIMHNEQIKDISKNMYTCALTWENVRNYLVKMSLKNNYRSELSVIANKVRDLAELEKNIALSILEIL